MTIKGTIYEIIFRNEENGYTIATVESEGHPVTAVGVFPPVTEGHFVSMSGSFVSHPRYGRQFKADSVRLDKPDSRHGMIMFLGSGLIKGIGPKRAESIVDAFGADTFSVIELNPSILATVPGISKSRAEDIAASYGQLKTAADALSFLMDYGISVNMAMKIYGEYGDKTIAAVSTNPYSLIEDVSGVGFITADRMAARLGIASDSDFRIRAGILYALGEAADKNGNTCLPLPAVVQEAIKVLGFSSGERVEENLARLTIERRLKEVECEDESGVMLAAYYNAESRSAAKLVKMLEFNNRAVNVSEGEIRRFERMNNISFHAAQREAIITALSSGVSVITGGPGTGKTTIVKCIISILLDTGKTVRLMAPTGRAAKRLSETTGQEASTIHRALMSEEDILSDAVIVDEFSMVDAILLSRMLEQLSDETKLIIVGDSDQLPSVGPGNVLADIIGSGVVPVSRLTQIFRQEECSRIILNAHLINSGEMPDLSNGNKDFFFIKSGSPRETAEKAVELVKTRLPSYLNCDTKNIQVLSPMKVGEAGCVSLNKKLRAALIPKGEEIIVGDNAFSVGDKVMHTVNNYNLDWRRGAYTGQGVFNGDLGFITSIRRESGELDVEYEDGRLVTYAGEDKYQLMLAYAITVHKSQGSEYDGVVLALSAGHYMIMTRNLLYTAITRAKSLVVILGDEETVGKMVRNNFIQKRFSQLKSLLASAKRKTELLYSE